MAGALLGAGVRRGSVLPRPVGLWPTHPRRLCQAN